MKWRDFLGVLGSAAAGNASARLRLQGYQVGWNWRGPMNKADVIRKVSETTGIESNICEKIIKAFEEQAGDALAEKLKETEGNHANLPAGISETTFPRRIVKRY